MEELYFYHSFPRPRPSLNRDEADALGLKIIGQVLDYGLLLVPEKQKVGGFDLMQARMCFTVLTPDELPEHAAKFGRFAMEFTIESMIEFGALPAIYLPERVVADDNLGDAGIRLLKGFQCLKGVLKILKDIPISDQRIGDVLKEWKTDLHNLYWVPVTAQNLFYPVDNKKHSKVGQLGYYVQREWKIINNFPRVNKQRKVVWDFEDLTPKQKVAIAGENKALAKEFEPGVRVIDRCQLFAKMDDMKVASKIRRFIVPSEWRKAAEQIVNGRAAVVSIAEVVGPDFADGEGI